MRLRNLWMAWGGLFVVGCAPAATQPKQNAADAAAKVAVGKTEPVKPEQKRSEPTQVDSPQTDPTQTDSPLEPVLAKDDEGVSGVTAPAEEPETPFTLEEGFTALSLSDFEPFAAEPDTWSATDDGFRCTGKPKGYLYSQAAHQNFTWKLEYRFERPKSLKDEAKFKGNTGFLVYINGEHKLWPLCLEVQGKHIQMAAVKENGGAAPVTVSDDDAARQAARKPVGQWNRLEIVSRDGALMVKLNDVPISRSEPNFLSEGKIGIQAEDHPFAVRRMRIRDE